MKRSVKVIIFTGVLFVFAAVLAVVSSVRAARYSRELSENYARALSGLTESVCAVDIGLHKCICAGTAAGFAENAAQVWAECQRGKVYLSELPAADGELDSVERFLAQAGDCAISTADSKKMTEEEYDRLIALSEYAAALRIVLEDISGSLSSSESMADDWQRLREFSSGEISDGGLAAADDALKDYPSMIYDGPYSDHIFERTPALIENEEEISEEIARDTASYILGQEVYSSGVSENVIGEYLFLSSDGTAEIAVTQRGGVVSYMLRSVDIGPQIITIDQARTAAEGYLRSMGMSGFSAVSHSAYGGLCVFCFAPEQDSILLYPDQIKVSVALDCGDVVAYDARDYIMNHSERGILRAGHTRLQAEEAVSDMLTVTDSRLVLIQTDGLRECLCYEFICRRWDGGEAAVFINADTLREEQIYLLSRTEDSMLAV